MRFNISSLAITTAVFLITCSKKVNSSSVHCDSVGTLYISVQLMIDTDLIARCSEGQDELDQWVADEFGEVEFIYEVVSESLDTCLATKVVDHFYVDEDIEAKDLLYSRGTGTGDIASRLVNWRADNGPFLSARPRADVLVFLRDSLPEDGSGFAFVDVIENPDFALSVVNMGRICNGRISIHNVLAHEIGHILGLSHRPERNAVMGPIVGSMWTQASILELNRKITAGGFSILSTVEPAFSPALPLPNPPLAYATVEFTPTIRPPPSTDEETQSPTSTRAPETTEQPVTTPTPETTKPPETMKAPVTTSAPPTPASTIISADTSSSTILESFSTSIMVLVALFVGAVI